MQIVQTRRRFLAGLTAGAAAGLLGAPQSLHAESPPETTGVRLAKIPGICVAPQYVAEEFLRAEGFTEVAYVATGAGAAQATAVANGEIDFAINFVPSLINALDTGARMTLLGGVHPGCFELFVKRGIDSVVDLKGKNVGVQGLGTGPHLFLASIAAYVGLDPAHDINWVVDPAVKPKELFARGDIDAFLGFPPEPQELRRARSGMSSSTAL